MKTILLAKSSKGEPYQVHFTLKENRLSVFCKCPAGIYGQLCKHKVKLLSNDTSMLFDPNQTDQLSQIVEWAKKTEYPQLLDELQDSEKEAETAKKKVKAIKERLARVMKTGLK